MMTFAISVEALFILFILVPILSDCAFFEKTFGVTEIRVKAKVVNSKIHFVSDSQTNTKDMIRCDNSTESRVASLSCNGAKSELQTSSTCIQPRNGLHVDTKQPQAMWILACLCSLKLILEV